MKKITKEEVLKVSKLARISIKEDEIEKYKKELEEVLDIIFSIEKVEFSQEKMISPTDNVNMLRDDEPRSLSVEEVLKNAPETFEDYIKVPRVVE
jgi:aspartyl-tRNA(Asn)/glutamyl-tRNA(Gln) amidotransferase subunit C